MKRILCIAGLMASGLAHSAILTTLTGNLVFPTATFNEGPDATSTSYPALILNGPADALVIGSPDNSIQPQVLKAGVVLQLLLNSEDELAAVSRSPGRPASISCDQVAVQSTEHHFAPYTCRVSSITFAQDADSGDTAGRRRGRYARADRNDNKGTPGTFDDTTGKVTGTPGTFDDTTGKVTGTPGTFDDTTGKVKGSPGTFDPPMGTAGGTPGTFDASTGKVVGAASTLVAAAKVTGTPGTFDETTGKVIASPSLPNATNSSGSPDAGHNETRWSQRHSRHAQDTSMLASVEPSAPLANSSNIAPTSSSNTAGGGVKVQAHGLASVPDAIVCRDSATAQLLFDLYNRSSHAAASRGENYGGGRARPTTWGCVRVAAGTAMTLHPGSTQPEVSVTLSDGTQYRGVTLDGMVQR